MASDRVRVGQHRRRKPSGGYTTVREHGRRSNSAPALIAGAAGGALLLGAAPVLIAAGLLVAVPAWAQTRWPDQTRALRSALGRGGERSLPVLRSAGQSVVARSREVRARHRRKQQFQREVITPLKSLREHPELLALVADAIEDGDEDVIHGALTYARQAEAAVRRTDRKRELGARRRAISRTLRREAKHAGGFYARTWNAPGPAWLSRSAEGVWSRQPGAPSPPRRKPPPAGGIADAAALATLGQLSAGSVEHKATKALRSIFDDLWARDDTPQ